MTIKSPAAPPAATAAVNPPPPLSRIKALVLLVVFICNVEEVLLFQMKLPNVGLLEAAELMEAAGVTVPSKTTSSVVKGVPVGDQLVLPESDPLVVFQVLVAAVTAEASAKPREIARSGSNRRVRCARGFAFTAS
jgi:hypothetical protein